MKVGYFDCFSGAAGDMIVAACIDAGADPDRVRGELAKLSLDRLEIHVGRTVKRGLAAVTFKPVVDGRSEGPSQTGPTPPGEPAAAHDHNHHQHGGHDHDHTHHAPVAHKHPHDHGGRNLAEIVGLIDAAPLTGSVKARARAVFDRLARAEARVHGKEPDQVHFHEVGAADAICDVVGACVALELLQVERLYCSPLVVGSGFIRCAHGLLPVPAPATAELIRGVPLAGAQGPGELLTPTGAALLTACVDEFGPLPPLKLDRIGYGAGQRDLPDRPNVLRLLVGEMAPDAAVATDEVDVLATNLDDVSPEIIAHLADDLFAAGALDVYCTAITMKKGRPGTLLTVLSAPVRTAALEELVFRASGTLGVRRHRCPRHTLSRRHETVETAYGAVRVKIGLWHGQVTSAAPEYEDCARLAREKHVALKEIMAAAGAAWRARAGSS